MNTKRYKYTPIGGETLDLLFDSKISKLNIESGVISNLAVPVLVFQDWSDEKSKDLFVLTLKDAIKLKSIIDNALLDFTFFENDYVKELMEVKSDGTKKD